MSTVAGLGKLDRKRLGEIIRRTKGTVSVAEAAEILEVTSSDAAKMLSRWRAKGWLSRVFRGIYIPVPLESPTADIALEDPWIIADRLYAPCYIGGWSAAEYWGLTEQIFRTIMVMTVRKPRDRKPVVNRTDFFLRTMPTRAMFGLKSVWRGQVKVNVSDPTRTVIDMLSDPSLGGGLRPMVDILINYFKSESKDNDLLIRYADQLGNGAVLKRLGYLVERIAPDEKALLSECRDRLTTGNAKIDPALPSDRLVTKWRLWVPANWAKEKRVD